VGFLFQVVSNRLEFNKEKKEKKLMAQAKLNDDFHIRNEYTSI
jgi:hypothetical protein